MTDVLFFVVLPFGGIAGLIGGIEIVSWHERKKVSNQIRARLGCGDHGKSETG